MLLFCLKIPLILLIVQMYCQRLLSVFVWKSSFSFFWKVFSLEVEFWVNRFFFFQYLKGIMPLSLACRCSHENTDFLFSSIYNVSFTCWLPSRFSLYLLFSAIWMWYILVTFSRSFNYLTFIYLFFSSPVWYFLSFLNLWFVFFH